MSFVEAMLGPAVSTDGNPAVGTHIFLLRMVLPTKFEAALTQLEAEPVGVGLDPTAIFTLFMHRLLMLLVLCFRPCVGSLPVRARSIPRTCSRPRILST